MSNGNARVIQKIYILLAATLITGMIYGISAPAWASSNRPAYVFMANDPKFFNKTSRTEKMQALEYARIAFDNATTAGGEKAAPYEYYMAKEYLNLAQDEFNEGDEISVIPFAAESRKYSLMVVDKTKGEAQ